MKFQPRIEWLVWGFVLLPLGYSVGTLTRQPQIQKFFGIAAVVFVVSLALAFGITILIQKRRR